MADDEKAPSTQQPAAAGDEKTSLGLEIEDLLKRVEDVSKAINVDSNQLSDDVRNDMGELSHVLDEEIKPKLVAARGRLDGINKDDEAHFPYAQGKREELDRLLVEIKRALQPRKQPQARPESEHDDDAQQRKKTMLSGCSPFKLLSWTASQQKSRQQGGQEGEEEEEEALSPKLLARLARLVLEPEQYYEWTTSYVDESRIFGWDKEADEVANALVSAEEGGFRAAAITGIHGSGKTALAQKVFIHDKAKDHFPIRLWVCVGPPDSEDRFNLLYRMLDNLGHDTNWIEDDVVDGAQVVMKQREALFSVEELEDLRKKADDKYKDQNKKPQQEQEEDAVEQEKKKLIYKQLLKEKVGDDREGHIKAIVDSKIGVLLYILHATLAKTGYLIVFDDIRAYGGNDGWYSNLTLLPPPPDKEWHGRLAYGLPKTGKHRSAVLVTCRKEDDARTMVRTGRVVRPPKLDTDNGWELFKREYKQAKKDKQDKKDGEDMLFKELAEMKKEIVNKCLGLPVAIIEAAKGFACLEPLSTSPAPDKTGTASSKDMQADKEAKKDADADADTDNKPVQDDE